ncbi:DUF4139 domain-containing protein [Sphingomonas hylomeconis]|uniref:DUF4139 domain-containing protein n=1 Tax=Sphingomonas hylomeconis TaxID=1395958 RepID=A0ABV7SR06_9SPHN|nr:hypothetical protein [Sphingomonas hylomeconis]
MRGLLAFALLLVATPAAAQTMVKSERIDAISVTLYRDPYRGQGAIPPRGWPGGYALITETRTISVPQGPAVIRLEGVSEGMMPETAIITGLPQGVGEKNRDARLISPAALIDAYLKRRVWIRRTNRATGKVAEGEAIIQSGPQGGVVLTTADGVEALGCSGLPEGLKYAGIPGDLAAKPTLSVTTDSARAATVTVQLSYLAQGFDWSANYVARVAPDGATLDLFAWLTVANGGSQGFAQASTQAVAGAPNKEANARLPRGPAPRLVLRCWPMDGTSTHPRWEIEKSPWPEIREESESYDIVVTGSRVQASMMMAPPPPPPPAPPPPPMMAQQEELGDLKLYRIPERVTVAALSRKQVAMIDRQQVKFERVYLGERLTPFNYGTAAQRDSRPAALILRLRNKKEDGLGLPLPAGGVAVFERARGADLLVGESRLADRAVDEEVELGAGQSGDVRYTVTVLPLSGKKRSYRVRVTNARDSAATFEIGLPDKPAKTSAALVERKGVPTWRSIVPANGAAVLDFTLQPDKR